MFIIDTTQYSPFLTSNHGRNIIISFSFKEPCHCKNLTAANGYGNCRAPKTWWENSNFDELEGWGIGMTGCYVQLPSGCPDLIDSNMIPGEKTSSEACIISEGTLILNSSLKDFLFNLTL